jgi:hypothetical protein
MLPKDFFFPDITGGGKKLTIKIQVPLIFVDENCVIELNAGVAGFNQNTRQAQAFKDKSEAIIANHNIMINSIFSTNMEISMPFVCEEHLVGWEIQAYPNDLGDLEDDLRSPQFHAVFCVIVQKL